MTAPPSSAPPSRARSAATAAGLLLAGVAACAVAVLLGLWIVDQVGSTRLWRVEAVVAPVVVAVGCVAAGWVGASCLVAGACAGVRTAGGAWRGGEVAVRRWAPGLVRRALAVAVAAGVGLGAATGAHAAVTVPSDPSPAHVTVDLGWTPTTTGPSTTATGADAAATPSPATSPAAVSAADGIPGDAPGATPVDEPRAADEPSGPHVAAGGTPGGPGPAIVPVTAEVPGSAPLDPTLLASPPPDDGRTVEVRPGDTLWGLAARALGAGATDAAIAAEWPRWYAANASAIGPDPDLLQPGQVLVAPTATDGDPR